jgi:hypothetical protein
MVILLGGMDWKDEPMKMRDVVDCRFLDCRFLAIRATKDLSTPITYIVKATKTQKGQTR